MRPAFSNALYYPTIDIRNINWLKTAILFWDSISTIVPETISHPYRQYDTQYLADIGFLRPLYVNSHDKSVIGIEQEILDLLYWPEFEQIICSPEIPRDEGIWNDKMSKVVQYHLEELIYDHIYRDKISHRIQHEIEHISRHLSDQKIFYMKKEFTSIYMITLANRLCEDHSLGMITDDMPCFNIGNTVRYGHQTMTQLKNRFSNRHSKHYQFEQGILLNFIINGLSISPDTPFSDIIEFKEHHKDELGRFRTQLTKLTQNINTEKSIEIVQQEISDLYNNEFMPAYNSFKAALTSSRIKWFTETFLKISLLSVSTTGVPMTLLQMPVEQALFAGMGVSVIASVLSYREDKKSFLRENPYSYLLSINRKWS